MINTKCLIGCQVFSVSLVKDDETSTVSASVEFSGHKRIALLHPNTVEVGNADILSRLVMDWPEIAGPYAGYEHASAELDISAILTGTINNAVKLIRDGYAITVSRGDERHELLGDSVIVIEVLLSLGNLLAQSAEPKMANYWKAISGKTALPPFSPDWGDFSVSQDDIEAEAEWYAAALGQDVDYYKRAAKWLHARQLAFAVGADGFNTEPTFKEYQPSTILENVPSHEEIDRIFCLSKEKLRMDIAEMRANAVFDRNHLARQITVFDRFFPKADLKLDAPTF
jgi:hypothetical protein